MRKHISILITEGLIVKNKKNLNLKSTKVLIDSNKTKFHILPIEKLGNIKNELLGFGLNENLHQQEFILKKKITKDIINKRRLKEGIKSNSKTKKSYFQSKFEKKEYNRIFKYVEKHFEKISITYCQRFNEDLRNNVLNYINGNEIKDYQVNPHLTLSRRCISTKFNFKSGRTGSAIVKKLKNSGIIISDKRNIVNICENFLSFDEINEFNMSGVLPGYLTINKSNNMLYILLANKITMSKASLS